MILILSAVFTGLMAEKATLIKVEGMIDNGVAFYIERGINTAIE